MVERNNKVQEEVLQNVEKELKKQGISKEKYVEFFLKWTPMTESRLTRIFDRTLKMPVTLKEITYMAIALRVEPASFFENVD